MKSPFRVCIATCLSAALCAGCATPTNQSAEPREEKIYRTGSNIPAKDYGAENVEVRGAEVINPINRPLGNVMNRKPGG